MRPDRIPLFPLNVVLFPGEQLPLHIFEARYRRMVRECLDAESPFGVLLAVDDGITRVGCTAEILEVVKRYPDGRMDIVTVGRDPFRIVELFNDDPLLEGCVDYLEDRDSSIESQTQHQLVELFETCHTLLFESLPRDLDQVQNGQISFAVASTLPIDLLWKQQILELRSESDRQDRLLRYLREWAPHLLKEKAMRQAASGNGHGLN
ncbi:MAG TPA: LON peptidase substrate-binding domain-containing protein [Candidatus Eisenbacteria bacterium]|nr:LON peptidase substrate-binding domain-containing protein [Candidatus Eisenbacteria bacterium]